MKIAVLGAGRMGFWLAMALAERNNDVGVYDPDRGKCERLRNVRVFAELKELLAAAPRILVNAVSPEKTVSAFRKAEPFLARDCILCDMASVKQEVRDYYLGCGRRFVSVHPMFGPVFTDMKTLSEESAVIIEESDDEGARFFRDFFAGLGIGTIDCSFSEHDRMMAYSLTVPFVSSLVFAACLDKKAVPGTTFKKHRAIAEGLLSEDDRLLSEILFNSYSLAEIDRITQRLEFLKHVIRARDYEEARLFFDTLRKNLG